MHISFRLRDARISSERNRTIMFKIIFALFVALAVLSSTALAQVVTCTRPNEEYQCGSACQTTCATLGERCPIVNIRCNDACYCIKGYARNNNGICIPIKACPPKRGKSRPVYQQPRFPFK